MAEVNGYDQDIMDARAHEPCEICKTRPAEQWNHCLHNRDKRFPILNRIYNLQHTCKPCHEKVGHTHANRRAFWWQQFRRYGNDFLDWWDELIDTFIQNLGYAEEVKLAREFEEERLGD